MGVGDLSWWPKFEREERTRRIKLPRRRRIILFTLAAILLTAFTLLALELRSSRAQSKLLANLSGRLHYGLDEGASPSFAVAPPGPYDARLGYTRLPAILPRLASRYRITAQAFSSPALQKFSAWGGYPVYPERSQAGLVLVDRSEKPIFVARYPREIYNTFDSIPPLIVQSLLYVENRKVLDDDYPYSNPAVEWNRLAKAFGDLAINKVYPAHPISGGSTLATQLEKVRHSAGGRTASTAEKFQQMTAASLRAYRNGEDTTLTRREIVRDYINSVPLGAVAGYGEVAGLQEGLFVWFGADPIQANALLRLEPAAAKDPELLKKQALAYRQVVSLLLALNRPTYYLREDKAALDARTDAFLRLFASKGIITSSLATATLAARTKVNGRYVPSSDEGPVDKGTLSLRTDLLASLGIPDTYALDRLDLKVASSLDGEVQQRVSKELKALTAPEYAATIGLSGSNLLGAANDGSVVFSFTLYERSADANLLRVESDNYDEPLNINRGTRLELGSTAKLRTLVSYLEIVQGLHQRYAAATVPELNTARSTAPDPITRWAVDHLLTTPDKGLTPMLEAALDRTYSASPAERFFTGGGIHTFSNFDGKDNRSVLTVREAFRRSVNLVFIRLMRDVEEFYVWRAPGASPQVLQNVSDPARMAYLRRFADQESRVFLDQFWREQAKLAVDEGVEALAADGRASLQRLTVIYRSVYPDAGPADLAAFLGKVSDAPVSDSLAVTLHAGYSPGRFNWNDLGYMASTHPLRLWLLYFREKHPSGTYAQAVKESRDVRQEIYEWLFKRKNSAGQNSRIRTVMEQDAFQLILASWKKQGYPFADIVPSYASALGSSGDNPAALAELAGIILNDGVRKPNLRVRSLHFAQGTPYETSLEVRPAASQRVYPSELTRVVRKAMLDVVENGTAHRAYQALKVGDVDMEIGGKTGTGDNRLETYSNNGHVLSSRAVSRTATFVFIAGDRYFGTVTAYVAGPAADNYKFTSALPVQLFKHLAPSLQPLLISPAKTSVALPEIAAKSD